MRIAGSSRTGVQLLQRAHGFQANGCSGIVQTQAIGGEVQGNQPQRRVAGRDFGHQAGKQWAEHFSQPFDDPGLFSDFQKAQPQGQGTEQQDHDLDRQLGHGEDAFDHCGEDPGIAAYQPLRQRGDGRDHKKSKPKAVEHPMFPHTVAANDNGVAWVCAINVGAPGASGNKKAPTRSGLFV
ncbi:hypothetical protein D3C80_1261990 [compost metagenome]